MKRVLSVCLAVLLMLTLAPGAFAGGLAGINAAWTPAAHQDNRIMNAGETLSVPLGASSFTSTGGALSVSEITAAQLQRLQVYTEKDGDSPDFSDVFQYSININTAAVPGQPHLQLNLTAKTQSKDTDYAYKVGLAWLNPEGSVAGRTQSASLFRLNGTVRASQSRITGFATTGSPAATPLTMQTGTSRILTLPNSLFTYSDGADQTITLAKASAYGIAARSGNAAFTARVVNSSGVPAVEVLVPAETAAGIYSGFVEIYSNNGSLSGAAILANLQITVPAAESCITGFVATDGSAVTPVTMQAGTTQLFSLPSELFTYSEGTDKTITPAKVSAYGIAARSTNGAFTARIVNDGGVARVEVAVPQGTAAGAYTGAVEIFSSTSQLPGKAVLVTLQITVPGQNVTGNKVAGIDTSARLGYNANGIWGRAAKNGSELPRSGEALDDLTVTGDDEITLEFNSDFFLWEEGKPTPAVWMTNSLMRNGRVSAKLLSGQNSNLVDSVDIKYDSGRAYVRVKFVERFVSTRDRDFHFSVALAVDGKVVRDTEAVIAGTMTNDTIPVYRDTDYVDLSYGEVAEAMESISRIEVDLGSGVSVFTRMTKGKLYYGTATTDPDNRDYDIMDRYRDIETVYNLSTVGLNSTGNTVKIDLSGRYHVYDRNLAYLGTTSERLPYSTKYYVSTRKLDIREDDVVAVDGDDYDIVDEPDPPTPGSTPGANDYEPAVPLGATPGNVTPPTNQYHNPVNGR